MPGFVGAVDVVEGPVLSDQHDDVLYRRRGLPVSAFAVAVGMCERRRQQHWTQRQSDGRENGSSDHGSLSFLGRDTETRVPLFSPARGDDPVSIQSHSFGYSVTAAKRTRSESRRNVFVAIVPTIGACRNVLQRRCPAMSRSYATPDASRS